MGIQDAHGNDVKTLCCSAFRRQWKTWFPHVVISKSGTDYCDTCVLWKNDPDHAVDLIAHKELAREEKKYCRRMIKETRDALSGDQQRKDLKALVADGSRSQNLGCPDIHCTFDYAQDILLPYFHEQPGQLYFLSRYKLSLFGIACETVRHTKLFVIPEGKYGTNKTTVKCPSCVVSLLYFFLEHYAPVGGTIHFHADNCPGQNKNRTVVAFMCWLVVTKRLKEVTLNFEIPGHTKNQCDAAFGTAKQSMRRGGDVDTKQVVCERLAGTERTVVDAEAERLDWRNWEQFLAQFFGEVRGIKKIFNFRFSLASNHDGEVLECHSRSSSRSAWKRFRVVSELDTIRNPALHGLSDIQDNKFALPPRGLTENRMGSLKQLKKVMRDRLSNMLPDWF